MGFFFCATGGARCESGPVVPVPSSNANIARHLSLMAAARPHDAAIKVPRGRTAAGAIDYATLSFAELETEVAAWSRRRRAGRRW